VRWSAPSPDGDSLAAFDPVVADTVVYVGYANMGVKNKGGLAAYDTRTGRRLWYHDFRPHVGLTRSARCLGNVVVLPGTVVAAVDAGIVVALNRDDGSLRWRTSRFPDTLGSSGAEARGVGAAGSNIVTVGSAAVLNGLDSALGGITWRTRAVVGSYSSAMANDGTRVYGVFAGGGLLAVDAATGAITWSVGAGDEFDGERALFGKPAVDHRGVYIGGQHEVFAYRR
jgi:outer membrane protein assembly factor BamB